MVLKTRDWLLISAHGPHEKVVVIERTEVGHPGDGDVTTEITRGTVVGLGGAIGQRTISLRFSRLQQTIRRFKLRAFGLQSQFRARFSHAFGQVDFPSAVSTGVGDGQARLVFIIPVGRASAAFVIFGGAAPSAEQQREENGTFKTRPDRK